jgi:hypothetical protein
MCVPARITDQMSGVYGASSFFRDNVETQLHANSNTLDDSNLDNELRNACREIRLISTQCVDPSPPIPAWSRLGFKISNDAQAAYESSSDLDARRKAGLGISMRFPCSRTALWDPQPQSQSTHLTHVLCIPSLLFLPSLVRSMQEYLTKCGRFDGDWELIGRHVTIDHQLSCKESITRGQGQIVFERFQRKTDNFQPLAASCNEFRAACISIDLPGQIDLNDSLAKFDESPFKSNVRKLPTSDHSIRPLNEGQRKCAEQRILEDIKKRAPVIPAKFLSFAIGCAVDNSQLVMVGEVTAPCESYVVTPLKLLKVIPTVLAQSLYDRDPAYAHGCSGFLSMDQTRRLLVLTEEDPKVAQLPLVGIWVSGVESLNSPFIWACLLRYRHCQGLGERVTQRDSFLLLCYQQSAILHPPGLAQVCSHRHVHISCIIVYTLRMRCDVVLGRCRCKVGWGCLPIMPAPELSRRVSSAALISAQGSLLAPIVAQILTVACGLSLGMKLWSIPTVQNRSMDTLVLKIVTRNLKIGLIWNAMNPSACRLNRELVAQLPNPSPENVLLYLVTRPNQTLCKGSKWTTALPADLMMGM